MLVWGYMCYVCGGVHELWVYVSAWVMFVREYMCYVCALVHELCLRESA